MVYAIFAPRPSLRCLYFVRALIASHNNLHLRPRQLGTPAEYHAATMWLNKNGLSQPDDGIVYCIQNTQQHVSQAGGLYATLGRDNYVWPAATRLIKSYNLTAAVTYLSNSCLPLHFFCVSRNMQHITLVLGISVPDLLLLVFMIHLDLINTK